MKTIQNRILEKFTKKFHRCGLFSSYKSNGIANTYAYDDVMIFLTNSIKEIEQYTRKKMIEELKKGILVNAGNTINKTTFSHDVYIISADILSLTQKENNK